MGVKVSSAVERSMLLSCLPLLVLLGPLSKQAGTVIKSNVLNDLTQQGDTIQHRRHGYFSEGHPVSSLPHLDHGRKERDRQRSLKLTPPCLFDLSCV